MSLVERSFESLELLCLCENCVYIWRIFLEIEGWAGPLDVSAELDHSLYDGDSIAVLERDSSAIKSLDFWGLGRPPPPQKVPKTTSQAGVPPSISDFEHGDITIAFLRTSN